MVAPLFPRICRGDPAASVTPETMVLDLHRSRPNGVRREETQKREAIPRRPLLLSSRTSTLC